MSRHFAFVLAALMLFACSGTGTGPIYPTQSALYEWVTAPEAIDPTSDQMPQIADPVVTFRLARGERRTAFRAGQDWRLGQTYLIGFDVRLERSVLGGQALILSRLWRFGGSTVELVSVELDARRGVTVMGRACVPPSDLGNWHRVEMRIRLSDGDNGYLEIFCDRKPVWAASGFRTTLPPTCRKSMGCDEIVPLPVRFEWQLGLFADGGATRNVQIQMQRLQFRRLYIVPNRVHAL